ncbi:MAG: glycine zipper 2TM domain-containing protein [Casimicrobiaceae bacterium]
MNFRVLSMALITVAVLLAGCAVSPEYIYTPAGVYNPPVYASPPLRSERVEYGVVESIDMFRHGSNSPVGVGSILGGVAGGVLGHQIGSGSGNTIATIAGAIGGALLGNQIERSNQRDRYRVTVRLDSGATLSFTEVGEGDLRVGDRVRILNDRVVRV